MNLNLAAPSTPATIVSGQKTLAIPIYQRLFVWGEKQIDTLLGDLWVSFTNPEKKDYYLGVITAHENDAQQWEIVDGQQRLTFLTLLGCVLARQLASPFPAEASDWLRFVRTDSLKLRLSFHGRSKDTEDIEKYLSREQETFQNHAFARFAERFSLFSYGKTDAELKNFSAYCFAHAAFLVNELPKVYGPEELNLYFEKMNSTGRQLTPLEVVKGKWFSLSPYASSWNACMNFDEQADGNEQAGEGAEGLFLVDVLNQTDKFKTIFGKTSSEQSNAPKFYKRLVMKGEMLALHVLKIMQACEEIASESEIPLDSRRLIETFETVKFEPAKFIVQLERYRKWIDQNIIYLDDDDGKTVYAFRSDKLDNDDAMENDSSQQKRMRQFQSMLYVSSGEAQNWVLDMYLELKGASLTYDALRKSEAKWTVQKYPQIDSKTMRYHGISRYWFWKLDYLLWELHEDDKGNALFAELKKEEDEAIAQYLFRQNRSIEHLHPQSKEGEGWGTRDIPESAMHRFGNLAMMSVEGNSAQSNDGIGTKFGRVHDWLSAKHLESIKMLLMFKISGGEEAKWNIDNMKMHEMKMIELLHQDCMRWDGETPQNEEIIS